MSVNIRTKERKTQKIEFFCKILFFATDKIRPRRTPVRLTGGYLPVLTIFSYPLRGCKETQFLYTPCFIVIYQPQMQEIKRIARMAMISQVQVQLLLPNALLRQSII